MLDDIDLRALFNLMQQGRMTWAELAGKLGLSAPAAADRVRQLESKGIIQQYTAVLNAPALGYKVTAFIAVSLDSTQKRKQFLARIAQMPEILECHHVTGEDDYWLKVRCTSTQHLDWLLIGLKETAGVARTRTTIVLSTAKETLDVPLGSEFVAEPEEE